MKRLAIGLFLLAGSLVTINSYSQVIVHAGIGIGIPIPAPPVVVYEQPYYPPQPVYRSYPRGPQVVVVDRGYRGKNDHWDDCDRYDRHNKNYKNNGNGRGHDKGRYDNARNDNDRYDNDRYDNNDNRRRY